MFQLGSLKRKKSGQRVCDCGMCYNNAAIPKFCDGCGFHLGGSYERPLDIFTDAVVIEKKNVASVRLNRAGENVRTFVDLQQNKVKCIDFDGPI